MSITAKLKLQKGKFKLDASFTVPSTGITAIFGPSGCGKTTLLRTLAGLEAKSEGELKIGDQYWQNKNYNLPTHQRALGYVFQEPSLFPHLSVKQNLAYGLKRTPREKQHIKFDEVVELLGVSSWLKRSPIKLSGGERQRVAIARALLTSPELLLMDEPMAALDLQSKAEIFPFLERLHASLKIPVFYVSHSPEEVARLADFMLLMDNGKVQLQGPLEETLSQIDSPLAQRDDAFSVLNCTVKEAEAPFHITELSFGANVDDKFDTNFHSTDTDKETIRIPRTNTTNGQKVRLRIQARDVSLCLDKPQHTSILNVLPAKVMALSPANKKGQRLVKLNIVGTSVLARLSEYSCEHLQLSPGKSVFAQIKAMALLS